MSSALTYAGHTKSLSEWCRELELSRSTIAYEILAAHVNPPFLSLRGLADLFGLSVRQVVKELKNANPDYQAIKAKNLNVHKLAEATRIRASVIEFGLGAAANQAGLSVQGLKNRAYREGVSLAHRSLAHKRKHSGN